MRFLSFLVFILIASISNSQISLTTVGTSYTQDFNTLTNSGTGITVPTGWSFTESGTNANSEYTAGTGSSNTGDTYSFGLTGNTERALGGLRSGSLIPIFGAHFTNNTGSTIISLNIDYIGETWRVGTAGRSDRLDFQYSLNATSLTTGTWVDVNNLDYANPGQATGSGSLQHSSAITFNITGLSLANGANFWIRWTDFDASSADDGLAIDDFSITPYAAVPNTIMTGTITGAPFSVDCSTPAIGSIDFTTSGTFTAGNTFTAQLSDASGSFTSPIDLATELSLNGTNPSGTINFSIPPQTPSGSGYRIRIIASNPFTTSPPNSSDISIDFTGSSCTPPYLTSVLINACSASCSEGENEVIFGNTGDYSVLANASNISVTYGSSPSPTVTYTDAFTTVPATTAAINADAGCTIVQDGLNATIPPNSSFLIARSTLCVEAFDWTSLCGLGPIYILYSTDGTWNTGGNFANSGSGMRYFNSTITTTGSSTFVVDYNYNSNLFSGSDGEFVTYGPSGGDPVQYGDTDCRIEPIFLPTELATFEAQQSANAVLLTWFTQSEQNNDYFSLSHSTNGHDFQQIGIVKGAGNSNELLSYQFVHERPAKGINYYRLTSTDFDGTTYNKGIVSVLVNGVGTYFDPLTTQLKFGEKSDYKIYSTDGKLLGQVMNDFQLEFHHKGLILVQNLRNGSIERLFIP